MTEAESLTLQMLRQIDRKLEKLLRKVSDKLYDHDTDSMNARRLAARAKEIAELTPRGIRQTDAVQLLHEDRSR